MPPPPIAWYDIGQFLDEEKYESALKQARAPSITGGKRQKTGGFPPCLSVLEARMKSEESHVCVRKIYVNEVTNPYI